MRKQAVTSTNELLRAQLEEKQRLRGIANNHNINEASMFNQ